ncbi:MAG: major capsid protein [Gaiellaceae bacterium]
MAITLAEAAKLSHDDLQKGVVETFILESVVLDRLNLLSIEGNAYAYNEEAALPGVEFRAVNGSYVESTGTVNQKTETLSILGGDADVDTFIVKTRGNLNDQRAVQTRLKVKAAVTKFQDTFINGDTAVDANSFDGLKKRLTGAQVIDAATNGLLVIGADDNARNAFFDKLDEAIAAVDNPGGIWMNRLIRQKVESSARRLTAYDETKDEFGRVVKTYQGLPLLDIGKKADNTLIIPQTEVQGTSGAACSSIYVVGMSQDESEHGVCGLFNGDSPEEPISVRDIGELDAKPAYRTRIEFFCGIAVFGGFAASRLRGVLNG